MIGTIRSPKFKVLLSIILFFGSLPPLFAGSNDEKEVQTCESSREYVTSIQYLRKVKDFDMQEKQRRDVADRVSKGCTGAAERFVVTTKVLLNAGVDSTSALKKGLKLANGTKEYFEMFIHIFKRLYLREELDLTLQESLNTASSISEKLRHSSKNVKKTFDTIVTACQTQTLPLPAKRCAQQSSQVIKQVKKFRAPLGKTYVKLYQFLSSKSGPKEGPNLAPFKAFEIADEMIGFGPMASQNFQIAYKFAAKGKGLDLSRSQAIDFAKKMTKRSFTKKSR